MTELVVVACHGPAFIDQCRASLDEYAFDVSRVFVDTSGTVEHGADVAIDGGHPTGALLWAYEQYAAYDRFLLVQDSMTAVAPVLPWFRDQSPGSGAVAWARFTMAWDSPEQAERVIEQYGDHDPPPLGMFGPVFYTDRASLDRLAKDGLLPWVPRDKVEAQGTERSWAFAFHRAGMPVVGPMWDHTVMSSPDGMGPFRKTWANRP